MCAVTFNNIPQACYMLLLCLQFKYIPEVLAGQENTQAFTCCRLLYMDAWRRWLCNVTTTAVERCTGVRLCPAPKLGTCADEICRHSNVTEITRAEGVLSSPRRLPARRVQLCGQKSCPHGLLVRAVVSRGVTVHIPPAGERCRPPTLRRRVSALSTQSHL